jgi:hypothetical protein
MQVISTEQGKFPMPQADEYTKFIIGDVPLQNIMEKLFAISSKNLAQCRLGNIGPTKCLLPVVRRPMVHRRIDECPYSCG